MRCAAQIKSYGELESFPEGRPMSIWPGFHRLLRTTVGSPPRTREDLEAFQSGALRRLVLHAYQNVPYYRRLFDQTGIDPRQIGSARDLMGLPITTKQDLRSQVLSDVISRHADPTRLIKLETSGSSGEPLVLYRTWLEQRLLHGFLLRANRYFGLRVRDRMAAIGIVKEPQRSDRKALGNMLRRAGIYRNERISAALEAEEILARIREIKPDVVTAYPSRLSDVAALLEEADRRVIRPRFLMAGAEVLTRHHRERVTEGFRAPVFDVYSCVEFHVTGWECRGTGEMHTSDDSVIVEVVRDDQPVSPGEQGEVVGTALHSYAMPLIRYRLGDLVIRGSDGCSCGEPYSTIRQLMGRIAAYVKLPDGRAIHESYLDETVFEQVRSWVAQYQFVQERLNRIALHMVPDSDPPHGRLESLRHSLTSLFGPDMEVEIQLVKAIEPHASGKQQVLRSYL
jgi:phenylacetate-CoA ligase